ncbi:hypothetical protein [Desulfosporosinus nitroreducens]|uniref:hypothetical protein n=1 Tax=Desulfosporosinus nitroreducens TaxID=2018668 RepID=UPI00207CDB37|nr:hypothetical protein [Desulfosporosinus nitroreducens]MCO1601463.1 hypothetical protein [Desulfosporosinus nitroreducens]
MYYLRKFKKVIAVLICTVLFVAPVFGGSLSAKEMSSKSPYTNIKELSISENVQKFKAVSEKDQYKELQKSILVGDYKVGKTSLIEIIDTSDNTPVQVLSTIFVKDGKPGIMGIATKNGESFAGAIIGESSDSEGINVSVINVDANKKIITETNRIPKKENKILSYFIKPAYADSFCEEFCNGMCTMGISMGGCYVFCTSASLGAGVFTCAFLCAGFTWGACTYGCPWYCDNL